MLSLALLGPIGATELLVILLIVVLLFGGRRIPELAKGLGEGIRNFRNAMKGDNNEGKEDKGGPPEASSKP
jgi:sec-independent protein translocase protein TatA